MNTTFKSVNITELQTLPIKLVDTEILQMTLNFSALCNFYRKSFVENETFVESWIQALLKLHLQIHAHFLSTCLHLRAGFVLTVISCPDLSRFSQLCKSTSTPQLYTPSSGSETGSPDAVQTVEGDSTSASSLRSQLPVDPARENENEGESNLESYAVFFVCCPQNSSKKFVGCLHFFCFCSNVPGSRASLFTGCPFLSYFSVITGTPCTLLSCLDNKY